MRRDGMMLRVEWRRGWLGCFYMATLLFGLERRAGIGEGEVAMQNSLFGILGSDASVERELDLPRCEKGGDRNWWLLTVWSEVVDVRLRKWGEVVEASFARRV